MWKWEDGLLCAILYMVGTYYKDFRTAWRCSEGKEYCLSSRYDVCWNGLLVNALGWLTLLQMGHDSWGNYRIDLIPVKGRVAASVALRNDTGQWSALFPLRDNTVPAFYPELEDTRCRFPNRRYPDWAYMGYFIYSQAGSLSASLNEWGRNFLPRLRNAYAFMYYGLALSSTLFSCDAADCQEVPLVALFLTEPDAVRTFDNLCRVKISRGEWDKDKGAYLIFVCKVVERLLEFIWAFRSDGFSEEKSWEKENIGYMDDIVGMRRLSYPGGEIPDDIQDRVRRLIREWHDMIRASCDQIMEWNILGPLIQRIEGRAAKIEEYSQENPLKSCQALTNIHYFLDNLKKYKKLCPYRKDFGRRA